MTLVEFKLTRRFTENVSNVSKLASYDLAPNPAFIYNGGNNWIDIYPSGVFVVLLGNRQLVTRSLDEAEAELWNYVLTL